MITMFGRVRRAVGGISSTEWALIGFEALGVVASILIAFALNDWGSTRQRRAELDRLLIRMQGETRRAVRLLNTRAVDGFAIYDASLPNAIALSEGKCPSDFGDIDALETFRSYDRPSLTTLDELRNRVGLSAIPDDLREMVTITSYQLDYMEDEFEAERQVVGRLLPLDDPRRHAGIDDRLARSTSSQSTSFGMADVNLASPRVDDAELCADRAFRERYVNVVEQLWYTTLLRNDTLVRMTQLCEALADYTGKPCFTRGLRTALGPQRIHDLEAMLKREAARQKQTSLN